MSGHRPWKEIRRQMSWKSRLRSWFRSRIELTKIRIRELWHQRDGLCHAYADEPMVGWPGCTLKKGHKGDHRGGE